MRLIFAGTPAFAAVALQALLDAGHDVALALTQPDRPAGRGLRSLASPVKTLALQRGLRLAQPATLRSPDALQDLSTARAPLMVVAAYGLLLPAPVLELFALGCVNIHASVLPRWRGAAPIQRALLAGDRETGISIMRMDAGLDTGPVYLTRTIRIEPDDTAGRLHDKLAALGAQCIVEALPALEAGDLRAVPQPAEGVTYAHKIQKQEAVIDWSQEASQIERQVRAFNPQPGASTTLRGQQLRVWRARALECPAAPPPGRVVETADGGIVVACGSGTVAIEELQRAGAKRLSAAEFLRGVSLSAGEPLGV
jgi:methionyl-tRNA formyltransferase